MPLNEYRYLKKTDKGQQISLSTGKPKSKRKVSDKAFDMMTVSTDKTEVDIISSDKKSNAEMAHAALMAGGFVPGPTGMASDAVDALLYLKEGKPGMALLAGLSIIPGGSYLFRGMGSGSDFLKSIRVAGKRVPVEEARKHLDKFELDVARDFDKTAKIFGGGHFPRSVSPSKNPLQLYTTQSAIEATKGYGPAFFRIEMDPRVLRDMAESLVKKGDFKGEKLLYKIDQPFSDVKHFMFSEGLPLYKIADVKMFTDYLSYANWLLKTKRIDILGHHKMMQKLRYEFGY